VCGWLGTAGRASLSKEISTAPGVRNNAKSIYKIQMAASGFKGRAK
jgi:hypothetical protein